MSKQQDMVQEFHKAFDIYTGQKPEIPYDETVDLRLDLINEEFAELEESMLSYKPIEDVAKELADLLYVVYGTALACGINSELMDKVFEEVHKSNMSKINGHKGENGKWIKPDDYEPPDIEKIIEGDTNGRKT